MLSSSERNQPLTGLRAMAVLAVFVHHVGALAPRDFSVVSRLATIGDAGVAVFFVLSGYLIYRPFVRANQLDALPERTSRFLWKRVTRIYPAYLAVFAVLTGVGAFRFNGYRDLLAHLTLTNSFRPASVFNGITQSWSLAVEVCFYLCVPLFARWVRRAPELLRQRAEWQVVFAMIAVGNLWRVVSYSVDWSIGQSPIRGIGFLWFPTHLDTFAAGMALAIIECHRPQVMAKLTPRVRGGIGLATLGAAALYAVVLGGPNVTTGYTFAHLEIRQLVYTALGFVAVGWCVLNPNRSLFTRVLSHPVAAYLGVASYGIYLWHFDILKMLTGHSGGRSIFGTHALSDATSLVMMLGIGVVGLIMTLAACQVLARCVEGPVAALRDLTGPRPPQRRVDLSLPQRRALARSKLLFACSAVVLLVGIAYAGLMRYQGPSMEEGFMLVFPEQLLHGQLPHKDFLHLYGPGSLWVLAAVFKFAGTTIEVERAVGIAVNLILGLSILTLLRPLGLKIATLSAAISVVIIVGPLGATAMAWNMAIAAAMACFAALYLARTTTVPHRESRWLVVCGVLAGIAVLCRLDVVLAVSIALVCAIWPLNHRHRRTVVGSYAATTALYLVHFATSGVGAAFQGMVTEPVLRLRAGRTLPVPPSWSSVDGFLQRVGLFRTVGWPFPQLAPAHQIFLWFWLVPLSGLTGVAMSVRLIKRGTAGSRRLGWHLLAPNVFGLLICTQAFQRPDTAHLAWVSAVSIPVSLGAVAAWLKSQGRSVSAPAIVAAIATVILVAMIPQYPLRTFVDIAGQSGQINVFGSPVVRSGRTFYFGNPQQAADAQEIVRTLASQSSAGQRLIVGTDPLSRTVYSDAFFYYLFPELEPGTRYIEMDPGLADAEDSGLAEELRTSDWLIVSRAWHAWDEPNASVNFGSEEPDRVKDSQFCPAKVTETFTLYKSCSTR